MNRADDEPGHPEDLLALVGCAIDLDGWDEGSGVCVEAPKEAAIEAAEELLTKRRPGERTDRSFPG
ncbi:hypothetical protein ABT224_42205 [Streptomyces sp. NPDC001584]|uniref:hypothetical protein n=1 Tax=Streptomyces sp. NPDC001584 TaxID=3154521 RepID=UPI003325F5BF